MGSRLRILLYQFYRSRLALISPLTPWWLISSHLVSCETNCNYATLLWSPNIVCGIIQSWFRLNCGGQQQASAAVGAPKSGSKCYYGLHRNLVRRASRHWAGVLVLLRFKSTERKANTFLYNKKVSKPKLTDFIFIPMWRCLWRLFCYLTSILYESVRPFNFFAALPARS